VSEHPDRSLLVFFLTTFALAWAFFIPVAMTAHPLTQVHLVLVTLGAWSPGVVALAMALRADGSAGVRLALEPALRARAPLWAYAFAALSTAGIKLLAALALRLATGAWPRFGEPPMLIPFAILVSTPFQAGEELGWRGYALPRWSERLGLRASSLLLGLVWAVWHLPLFFVEGADTYRQSFPVYMIGVVAISVIMAWLYARTGSLLLVMLLHAAVNNSKDLVPSGLPVGRGTFSIAASQVGWLSAGLWWLVAAACLATMPARLPPEASRAAGARPRGDPP
jgi:membrane protease YdiL (CAAX protease family)